MQVRNEFKALSKRKIYDSIQATKHLSRPNWVKIEVLLYEVPYIISYAEFSGEIYFRLANIFNFIVCIGVSTTPFSLKNTPFPLLCQSPS